MPEGPGDLAGHQGSWAALPGDGSLAKTLGGPTLSSADIIEVTSIPSLAVFLAASCEAYSWGGCEVPSRACFPRDSCENTDIPEGRASSAFVSPLSKTGREKVAAPKLPNLKVNFN